MNNEQIETLNILIHKLNLGVFNRTHNIDGYIMDMVSKNPNISIKDLLSKLGVPQSTLSSSITRLCDKKILKRSISEEDTRSFTVQLTEEGQRILNERLDIKAVENAVSSLESDEEIDELIRLLKKIVR